MHLLLETKLLKNGYIIIYDNDFQGTLEGNDSFKAWYEDFLLQYPRPQRDNPQLDQNELGQDGFTLEMSETYDNKIKYDLNNFVEYLLTLSNMTVALKTESRDKIFNWLLTSLKPFFNNDKCSFEFGGYIWYIKYNGA